MHFHLEQLWIFFLVWWNSSVGHFATHETVIHLLWLEAVIFPFHFLAGSLILTAGWLLFIFWGFLTAASTILVASWFFYIVTICSFDCDTAGAKPGPKSGRSWRWFRPWPPLLVLLFISPTLTKSGGEGCDPMSMGVTEAPAEWIQDFIERGAKHHGLQPADCKCITPWTSWKTPVLKRSIHRAYKRACISGLSWYKGRPYTPADFPVNLASSLKMDLATAPRATHSRDIQRYNMQHKSKHHASFCSWNVGGLSMAKLDELKCWLVEQQIDLAVCTETRWHFENEWVDADWSHVHTGLATDKGSGILVLIHKRLCPPAQIRWGVLQAGRLLHIQLRLKQRNFDVLACYQHVYNNQQSCLQNRAKLWRALDTCLRNLPTRNVLALLGDFNCHLNEARSIVGTGHFKHAGHRGRGTLHPDAGELMSILKDNGLCVLNTWDESLGPTFVNHISSSRIDFIMVRKSHADGHSKNVRYIWQAPFLPPVPWGHVPIVTQIRKFRIPCRSHQQPPRISIQHRQAARDAYILNTEPWQIYRNGSSVALANHLTQIAPGPDSITKLHDFALTSFSDFTTTLVSRSPTLHDTHAPAWIPCKWHHRRCIFELAHMAYVDLQAGLKQLLDLWFHQARFQRLSKQNMKFALAARQAKFDLVIHQAELAAANHDSHKLFQLINKFAPKQPMKRLQIRNCKGQLATPVEELAILKQFVAEQWHGSALTDPFADQVATVPFSVEELEAALSSIPVTKAVAAPFAPGLFWKTHANILAPWIYSLIQSWWNRKHVYIPETWKHGWLHLIPKPNKPPVHPKALRPLALQDPIGKCLIGLLGQKGQAETWPVMQTLPLWAYLAERSTQDALARVSQHCREARQLVRSSRSTPSTRALGLASPKLAGAVQIFLDLSRAFDTIDRPSLFGRLVELGVSVPLVKLLIEWHTSTAYIVSNGIDSDNVSVYRGVRQGCKAAPWLWNCLNSLLLLDLSSQISLEWLQSHLNLFADDYQAGDVFATQQQFEDLLHRFGLLVGAIQTMGLTINLDKSVILLVMTGPMARQCRRRHTVWKGDKELLILPFGNVTFHIPIELRATYLGTIISYHNFEDQTMQHRIRLAQIAFRRLSKWLTGRRGMPYMDRIKLWQTCVRPVATYGLFAVGLTLPGIIQLQQTFFTMIRKILKDHAYLTGHTNSQVLTAWDLAHPLQQLWHLADQLQTTASIRQAQASPQNIVKAIDLSFFDNAKSILTQALHSGSGIRPMATDADAQALYFACPQCSYSCNTLSGLRRHCTVAHHTAQYRTQFADFSDYMHEGLPQCTGCHKSFTTWRSFNTHVQRGCPFLFPLPRQIFGQDLSSTAIPIADTPALDRPATDGAHFLSTKALAFLRRQEWGPRLLDIVSTKQWERLRRDHSSRDFLSKRCMLCQQWIGRAQDMTRHYQLTHPTYWKNVLQKSTQLSNLFADSSPCEYCGCVFVRLHRCNVWTQVSVLLLYLQPNGPADLPPANLTCEICDMKLESNEAMHLHLITAHKLPSARWNSSHDSIAGEPACAHCGQLFGSIESLRSHINQSRCSMFDPNRTSETLDVDPMWIQAMCRGQLMEILQPPRNRQALTLRCQCCDKSVMRAADCMLHLQTCHAEIWALAAPVTRLLMDLFYHQGCRCNPITTHLRLNHICVPFQQLAMQYVRLPTSEFFLPCKLTEMEMQMLFAPTTPVPIKNAIAHMLLNSDFQTLWLDQELLTFLRSRCLLCAWQGHAAEMCLHLRQAHDCNNMLVMFYVQQLLPLMMTHADNDHSCFGCGLIFNHPITSNESPNDPLRLTLVRAHFKGHCPCLLQLAIALATAADGRRRADGTNQRPGGTPNSGDVSESATLPHFVGGRLPGTLGESRTAQKAAKRRRTQGPIQGQGTQGASGGPTPDPSGSQPAHEIGPTTRSRTSSTAQGRYLSLFFRQKRKDRSTTDAAAEHDEVEGRDQRGTAVIDVDSTETTPGASLVGQSADQTQRAGQLTPGLGSAEGGADLQCAAGRQHLPISGVECPETGPGSEQADAVVSETGGGECGGADRNVHIGNSHQEVPLTSLSSDQPIFSMGFASGDESGSRTCSLSHDEWQCHLGTDGSYDETTYTASIPTCPAAPTAHESEQAEQAEGDEQGRGLTLLAPSTSRIHLLSILAGAIFSNPGNWCFANSATLCFLWATLSLVDFDWPCWGNQAPALLNFVLLLRENTGQLMNEPWFCQVLAQWGRSELSDSLGSISQQDAAEYIGVWFEFLQIQIFDMAWERRIQQNETVVCIDHSKGTIPIWLQFDSLMLQLPTFSISALLNTWQQVNGMVAGLLHCPTCLCLHIDRCRMDEDTNQVFKHDAMLQCEDDIVIPIFVGAGLETQNMEFTVVAYQAHLGGDRQGHYRTAIRTQPAVSAQDRPVSWLLCDDHTAPIVSWTLPRWFLRNIIMAWLIRSDRAGLFAYHDCEGGVTRVGQDLLHLLSQSGTDMHLPPLPSNPGVPFPPALPFGTPKVSPDP